MLKTAFIAAAVACALATAAAEASTGEVKVVEGVNYADLDLGSKSGADKLKSRIRLAAARICSDYERPAPTGLLVNHRCFRAAMDDALRQMDEAMVHQKSKRNLATASDH